MRFRLYSIISILYFAVVYFYTAIGVVIVLVLALLKFKKPVITIIQYWAKSLFLVMGKKITIRGKEYINKDEKYILLANHASLFDIVAIVSFYPGISWFGHERLLKVPLFGTILRIMDYVPFKEPNYRNTRNMMEQLMTKSEKSTVAMFPEGTRTLNGKINTFYRGFIYLFRTREMNILPVTLNGFYDLKPKTRMYIDFRSKLGVVIHEPIRREVLADKTDTEIIETVKNAIESAYIDN